MKEEKRGKMEGGRVRRRGREGRGSEEESGTKRGGGEFASKPPTALSRDG